MHERRDKMKKVFSIVVKTVVIKENKALCLIRSDREVKESSLNSIDLWDLPGGGMQYYEKLEECLYREAREETGLKVNIIKPLDAHDIIRQSLHVIFLTYLSECTEGEVILSSEHKQYKWADRSELEGLPIQKWLKKIYVRAFEEYDIFIENRNGTM